MYGIGGALRASQMSSSDFKKMYGWVKQNVGDEIWMKDLRMAGLGNQPKSGRDVKQEEAMTSVVKKWGALFNRRNPTDSVVFDGSETGHVLMIIQLRLQVIIVGCTCLSMPLSLEHSQMSIIFLLEH